MSLLLPPVPKAQAQSPCSSGPSPECALTHTGSGGSGSTARVERPSLCAWETFSRCGKVVGFMYLPGNAWSPGQRWPPRWIYMDFLHKVEYSFSALPHLPNCTHDPLGSLDGDWQLSNEATNSTLHCALKSSEEPAPSKSCTKISSYTGPAHRTSAADQMCLWTLVTFSVFWFLLNKYRIIDTSTEIWKKTQVFYQHLKVQIFQWKATNEKFSPFLQTHRKQNSPQILSFS